MVPKGRSHTQGQPETPVLSPALPGTGVCSDCCQPWLSPCNTSRPKFGAIQKPNTVRTSETGQPWEPHSPAMTSRSPRCGKENSIHADLCLQVPRGALRSPNTGHRAPGCPAWPEQGWGFPIHTSWVSELGAVVAHPGFQYPTLTRE